MKKWLSKGQKGFTLIELLIVVAILGVLAVVVIPSLSHMVGVADLSAANTEADTIRTAILAYETDNHGASPAGNYDGESLGVLDPYIDKVLIGSYTVSSSGQLTGTGGWSRLEWSSSGLWVKK